MTEVLIFDKSYERIKAELHQRLPAVSAVVWSKDGSLLRDGRPVDAGDIAPVAGWISSDMFAARCLGEYADAAREFASMQWMQSANAGLDHPIYPKLAARGIRLCKSGAQSIPIAEYVLAQVLSHFQDVPGRRRSQDAGQWKPHRFRELWQSRWLIVGYGHIGRGVAKRVSAFDADIVCVRQRLEADEYAGVVVNLERIDEYLPWADVVVLACPATEETQGLADDAFFGKMKPGSVLVNIARGSLVDEQALLRALEAGTPAHAVLDVFEKEPLPAESALWKHPSVVVTAHTSNAGNGTRDRGDTLFLDNLERFIRGDTLLDEVKPSTIQ